MTKTVNEMLRAVASGLQTPTVVILLFLIALTAILVGTLVVEIFTERRQLKGSIPKIIDDLQGKDRDGLEKVITSSGLLKRQKNAVLELVSRDKLPLNTRIALARKLVLDEEKLYVGRVKVTDFIAKVAPMFGLMGTLIPLAPGLIALGQGDTKTLSESLLVAFDTTVAGLICAVVAMLISAIRKSWYSGYSSSLEAVMEAVLDCQGGE